jgi:hypothetical protein
MSLPNACVQKRLARSTRTIVGVYRPGYALSIDREILEVDPEGGWTTICEYHGGEIQHSSRAVALSWASAPDKWCPSCQNAKELRRYAFLSGYAHRNASEEKEMLAIRALLLKSGILPGWVIVNKEEK